MTILMWETPKSRKQVIELHTAEFDADYFVCGSDDDTAIYQAVLLGTPLFNGILYRKKIDLQPQGGPNWFAVITYGVSEGKDVTLGNPNPGDGTTPGQTATGADTLGPEFSFDTTGGTEHRVLSKQTRSSVGYGIPITPRTFADGSMTGGAKTLNSTALANFTSADVGALVTALRFPAGTYIVSVQSATQATCSQAATSTGSSQSVTIGPRACPSFNRAIGVSKDAVAGVDAVAPKLEFSETRNITFITLAYVNTLYGLTGKTNNAPFYSFARGDLLFLGATGQIQQDGKGRITFKFAASPRQTNVDLVDDDGNGNHLLRIPEKFGWDYIWAFFADSLSAGKIIRTPAAAYCERIYDEGDFSLLGI